MNHTNMVLSILCLVMSLTGSGCNNGEKGNQTFSTILTAISVAPASSTIVVGESEQFTATGRYSDGSIKDLTSSVSWASLDTTVADISDDGMVSSTEIGTTSITATSGVLSASATINVTSWSGTNSVDADGFIWGTEGSLNTADADNLPEAAAAARDAINDTLKTSYVKFRFSRAFFSSSDGGLTWSDTYCLPSAEECNESFNMDEVAALYQANGWSMVPMIRHDESQTITSALIDEYVNFVDWFLGRYKGKASIKMIELVNNPIPRGDSWQGTSAQLVELSNKTYDRVKSKYQDVLVGTPGFEYFMDSNTGIDAQHVSVIEYFLDKNNGAKFDFWAFHGYPLLIRNKQTSTGPYPPTMTPTLNKYANVVGILNIRAAMDANGWQDRKIIDTEHGNITEPGQPITADGDALDAAYVVQELTLKRTLMNETGRVLSGVIPLKITPIGTLGEAALGSLNADGSVTFHVKAMAALWAKLTEYKYVGHVSGEFDDESQAWVEKFSSGNRELYIFFKPFKYVSGQKIYLDGETNSYTLNLNAIPSSVILTDLNGDTSEVVPSPSLTLSAANDPKFLEVIY